jgi:hypothetical protein
MPGDYGAVRNGLFGVDVNTVAEVTRPRREMALRIDGFAAASTFEIVLLRVKNSLLQTGIRCHQALVF